MPTRRTFLILAAAVAMAASGCLTSATVPREGLVTVSTAASPRVSYAVERNGDILGVLIAVEPLSPKERNGGVNVQLGVAADKTLTLSSQDAKTSATNEAMLFEFKIPAEKLVDDESGWARLRMGLAVEWDGGPAGQPRQRESFLQSQTSAPHAGLSSSPTDWLPLNLAEFERAAADRRLRIGFTFQQPCDGKATIVIDDAKGGRVRNLVSGEGMGKGTQHLVWDGCDDSGTPVPPGEYRWRAISHPGLKPHYLMSFCNGPGSNHGTLHSAATNGTHLFFGTSVSEGGYELIQLSPDGTFVRGYNSPMGHGLSRVAVAADEKFLYAVYDGTSWGQHVDRSKPDWKADNKLTLVHFDLVTGNPTDFKPSVRLAELRAYSVGPGSAEKLPDRLALAGITILKGRLYVGDAVKNEILDVDPATGAVARSIPLENPVALAADAATLYAVAGKRLLRIDPATGQNVEITTALEGRPTGLAVDADGKFHVSDAAAHVVRILDKNGKQLTVIGKPGGITGGSFEARSKMGGFGEDAQEAPVAPGPYDPLKLHNPAGLVIAPDGHLWVTENERWTPKRLAAYDPAKGTMWKEFFGPTAYGAPGCGFDPDDSTTWLGQGVMFKVDLDGKTTAPVSILGGEEGMHYRFWRQEGRTFVIAYGKATYIEELLPDNTLKPLAFLSSAHQYAYARSWKPPKEFVEAFTRDYPNVKYEYGKSGSPNHGYGMLWVDRNGDGKTQADEIEFSTAAESLAGSGWGHDFNDLTMRIPAKVAGKSVMVALKPDGWWPGGAPKYPALNDAVKAAIPIDGPAWSGVETTMDRFGDMIVNSDPEMRAFAPDGRLLWRYPNRWSNVHGSHNAPLPTAGELQGILFFTGVAPLDDKADVLAMNGNHGRAFLMTSDGLYLDEMFPDCRLMTNPQAGGVGILGGECFGGTFGLSKKTGEYYFQGGGIEYRVYRVDGLKQTTRSEGTLTVSPEQAVAAERDKSRSVAAVAGPRKTRIPFAHTPPALDGKGKGWPAEPVAQWNKGGQFPVTINAVRDNTTLYLRYAVQNDSSPWINNGKDWQLLFKTGDGVDLQIGSDPKANSTRTGPVPGDLRLFVAPFQGGNIAVLYRHRLPGATDSVVFQSPWRSEKVDSVKKLESARIAVERGANAYSVEIAVPLAELGLATVSGQPLKGDFGIIYGDADGTTNIFRNYWSNQATGLVNDVPGEIMLAPNLWGEVVLEGGKQ